MTTGLTPFILAMMATPPDKLARADPVKVGAKYGVRADWAGFYIREWINRA